MGVKTLTNVRPWGAAPVDIVMSGGAISAVEAAGSAAPRGEPIDGRGLLALPGFINAHAHVDKSWWGQPWVSYGGDNTTAGRIAHERAERGALGIPSPNSTAAVLREFLRHGTTAVRSHVDVDLGVGLRGIEVVREAVEALGDRLELEVVAFPQDGVVRRDGVLKLLDEAAAAGATSIGGIDPCSIDRDPVAQLDGLFDIAVRRGVGIDIHIHDRGELGAFQYELVAERVRANGLRGKVTISHGFALGELPAARQRELLDRFAEAGIGWATVAPPGTAPLPWRGMRERGIPVGLGTDGIRDLWSPFGDGDILLVAQNFARLHGQRGDADLAYVVELATSRAAGYVHRDIHDLVAGARADIVLLDAENVADALTRCPRRAMVIAGGTVAAVDGELTF
ncbi:MAG TPA: amidohydrolase family protein [Stackebrandtia sp.]|uniref:amidohydrolase family protein n=1 Tax=Stackebrandtia sp. TaxID=2023065 RepID=UPI002D36D35A|nr:amidohydrolase family protein [Stackebrandtia sp.]HZE41723.1 amidohydrolase family protein [Stackebrandtia sp.]